jgi:tetratricopeptide (TPR) repeat protein
LLGATATPILAPGLTSWLPARVSVHEELAYTAPPGWTLLTVATGPRPTDPAAVVARDVRREPDKVVLVTDVERPTRHLGWADQERSTNVLKQAQVAGPELLFAQDIAPGSVRTVRAIDRPPADRVALEALVWWRLARYPKARKLLDRYLDPIGLPAMDEALVRYDAPYELRRALVDLARTDRDLMATVPLLVAMERRDEALVRAAQVARTREHDLRVASRLAMLDLQSLQPPDAQVQPDLASIWRDPEELLAEADASGKLHLGAPDPRVQVARARRWLAAGRLEEARVALTAAAEQSEDPRTAVLLAQTLARLGAPLDSVLTRLDDAVQRAPADPAVLADVADTLAATGLRAAALRRSLAAARIAGSDEKRWSATVDHAMAAGDLASALYAARRASDLALRDTAAATRLTLVATLAGDDQQANLGWTRGGTPISVNWPPKVAELLPHVPENWLLAVLRHHDVAVVTDPALLSLRAQLELAGGDRNRAARDGLLLADVHGIARGAVVAFGASIGEIWQSDESIRLDDLVRRDPAAREARVELRAITGGVVDADLKIMKDEPRARPWLEARRGAEALAALDPTWKPGVPPKASTPRGYSANPLLGAARGVAAWSYPEARRAIVRHGGTNLLPPPLSVLYSVRNPPLRSLPGGGTVVALDGGSLPLYAAWKQVGTERILGLGYSPEDAARALDDAPP